MAKKTYDEALLTKERIKKVAKRLFCVMGYEKTNLSLIAQKAGVTRGAIYWYYKNKDDLFINIFKEATSNKLSIYSIISELSTNDEVTEVLISNLFQELSSFIRIKENQDIMKIIFHLRWGKNVNKRIRDLVEELGQEYEKNLQTIVEHIAPNQDVQNVKSLRDLLISLIDGCIWGVLTGKNNNIIDNHVFIAESFITIAKLISKESK
jgi:TetR/AcrR family acrAB operon transcriptional repressor